MSNLNETLTQLYALNLKLLEQLTELVQKSGAQWTEQRQRAIAMAVVETQAELRDLISVRDPAKLVAHQTRIVRKHWEARQRAIQEAMESVSGNAAIHKEAAERLAEWHQGVVRLGAETGAEHITGPWVAYLSQFPGFWSRTPDDKA